MKLLPLIFILLLFNQCEDNKRVKKINLNNAPSELFTKVDRLDTLYYSNDTIAFIKYVTDNSVLLNWGIKDKFLNTGLDTLYYPYGQFISFKKRGEYFVVFDGCGTGCNYTYIALIKFNGQGKIYLYPLANDLNNNMISYQGGDNFLAIIENLKNGKSIMMKEQFNKNHRPYTLSIDTCYFSKSSFFISWELPSGEKSSKKIDLSTLQSTN